MALIRPISLHSIFEFWISEFISNSEKNRVQNQLDFFSSSNLIFTACVACKNQFRNQIDFLIIQTWYFEIEKNSCDTRYFKNQVEIDRGCVFQMITKLSYQPCWSQRPFWPMWNKTFECIKNSFEKWKTVWSNLLE